MLENETSSITQCGRKISDQEIEQIKETVDLCWRLSRYELAQTIAENLGWYTASGSLKVDAGVKLLEKLQAEGVLQLPEKRGLSNPNKRSIPITPRTAPAADIDINSSHLLNSDLIFYVSSAIPSVKYICPLKTTYQYRLS